MKNVHDFASAVILAGGKSTRMGFDKQLLKMNNRPIVQHLITLLSSRFNDIMIASSTPELYDHGNVRVIEDIYKDAGPLGGIHSALVKAKNDAVFVIACDMPFVEISYIDYMLSRLKVGNYDACLTSRGDYLETFHAFYCRSSLPVLEDDLANGKNSVHRFARKINSLIIAEDVAQAYLPGWRAFMNLNTPEEYESFKQSL